MQKHSDLIQKIIIGLFNLLVCTVPFFFTFNTEELFEFNKMVLTYAITTVIVFLHIVRMIIHKQMVFRRTALDIPIALFVLSQLLSTLFSIHPYTSLLGYYTRFHGGLLSTFTYAALYYVFVNTFERRHFKAFFFSLIGTAALVSIYGIFEHFGFSFSCYLATGGESGNTSCWVQDVKTRVFASFGQPNWLAAYLIELLPLTIYLAYVSKKIQYKLLGVSSAVLMFLAILFTRSRSGFFGLAIGMAIFVLCLLFLLWRKGDLLPSKLISKAWSVLVIGVLFVFFVFTVETPLTPTLTSFFSRPNTQSTTDAIPTTTATTPAPVPVANRLDEGGTDSGEIRKIVWSGAIKVWQRYPIFGSGVETFGYSYYLDRPVEHNLVSEWDFLYNKAHNEFLNFLATTGAVGLGTYCLLLGSFAYLAIKRGWQADQEKRYNATLFYVSLISGVISLSISNFFGFSTVMVTVLLFLFFALNEVFDAPAEKLLAVEEDLQSFQYAILSIAALGTSILLFKIYSYWTADIAYTRAKALMTQGQLQYGLEEMSRAVTKNKEEALFYDTLADEYSAYAIHFANAGEATAAAQLAERAISTSDIVLALNPHQINYYKTRARILINMSQFNPKLLDQAKEVLRTASNLAPTDAKLVYNLGLIESWQGKSDEAISLFQKALALKPNYDAVRTQLAEEYTAKGQLQAAIDQYQYIVTNISPNDTVAKDRIASLSAELKKK